MCIKVLNIVNLEAFESIDVYDFVSVLHSISIFLFFTITSYWRYMIVSFGLSWKHPNFVSAIIPDLAELAI